jgi:hypothetical protein
LNDVPEIEGLQYIPEVGGDLVATVRLLLVLLWSALGYFEAVRRVNGVAGERAATNLAAVDTMAKDLAVNKRLAPN